MNNQQAIDRLVKHLEWGWSEETVEAIDMGIHALKGTQWIPCSERLPKHAALCCDRCGAMLVGFVEKSVARNGRYYAYDDDGETLDDCVAWMPLPEPYKEEEIICE